MGSIADRMKALSGRGLDVGASKPPGKPTRHRAGSNASASSSDKQRPRTTIPKVSPQSLPTVNDGLPARSRSNSKAQEPEIPQVSPSEPRHPPIPAPKPAALTHHPIEPEHPPQPEKEEDFEKAFPSLAEFGKQFEEEDFEVQRPKSLPEAPSFPDVPAFDLPSVPTTAPSGLPPPPSRPENLDPAPISPVATKHDLPASLRPNPPPSNPPSNLPSPNNLPISLRPNPPPSTNPSPVSNGAERPPLPPKPKFPLTNSIVPEVLRSYILHPAVDMLVLDVRPEQDNKKGYVGQEYESKGYVTRVVWIDPTVLMRNE
jgi:ubiquitin carboxyl-terminal hydrolase 8